MKHLNWMAYHPLFGSVYGGLEICMEGKTVYGGCSLQSGHHLFCDHMRIAHVWHMVLLSMLIYCCMSSWPQEFLVTYDLFCYCMHGGIIMKYWTTFFSSLWSIFTIVVTTNTRKKACWSLCGKSISVALTGGVLCIITYLWPLLYFKCFSTHY